MRRNNKGFTLVELLAVIVILAIVALVVVPVVMGVIKDARKKSAIESFRGYMDAVEKTIIRDSMKATSELPAKDSNGCYNLNDLNPKIKIKGDKPVIDDDDDKLCVTNGKITTVSEVSMHGYTMEFKNNQILFNGKYVEDTTVPEITIGEVTTTKNSITIPYEVQNANGRVTAECVYGTSNSYGNQGTIEDNKCILSNLEQDTKYYYNIKIKTSKRKTANQASSEFTACDYAINQQFNYSYTGGVQTFTPVCKGNYKLEVWGASGGGVNYSYSYTYGGMGGYSYGTFNNDAKSPLYVVVGGQGTRQTSADNGNYAGGYNGGGIGQGAGGGGGATHIGLKSAVLTSFASDYSTNLLLVAGAGGGANAVGGTQNQALGGYGGGTSGGIGYTTSNWSGGTSYSASPGTQSAAGSNSSGWNGSGGFGKGRDYYSSYNGGGGGGFYGGANGAYHGGSGAGGSGYVNTNKLSGAATIAGNQTFKAPSGSNETGHPGHGYARITYLGR